MAYKDLLVEKRQDGLAIVTLNQPEKLNALSSGMITSLAESADELAEDDDVRVVIVTGAGRGFCAGADVSMMGGGGAPPKKDDAAGGGGGDAAPPAPYVPSRASRLAVVGHAHYDVFPRLEKPVIAAINGPCVGGGLSLALSCDIRISSDTAKYGVAQVARGLVPDYGLSYYLPLAVGLSKAAELMFTAELFSAAEAERIGMVSKVVPGDELMPAVEELALKIAAQPPLSVEITKRMVWVSRFDELIRAVDLETWGTAVCSKSEDHKASVTAFLGKQPTPKYTGR